MPSYRHLHARKTACRHKRTNPSTPSHRHAVTPSSRHAAMPSSGLVRTH
jgi:hypothetical protein